MAEKAIDPKYLAGLKFRGSVEKEVKEDGKTKKRNVPFERSLKVEDVLDWADKGATVVIVTADGQKYSVEKNPKKTDAEGKKEEGK